MKTLSVSYPLKGTLALLAILSFHSCNQKDRSHTDWLLDGSAFKSVIEKNNGILVLSNGLISRTFCLNPTVATISFENPGTGKELLRAVKPEAVVSVDGTSHSVGGLVGQPVKNFLTEEFISQMKAESTGSFVFKEYHTGDTEARFGWKKRLEWMPDDIPWPPHGIRIDFNYVAKKEVGRLAGWPVGRLAGWPVGRLADNSQPISATYFSAFPSKIFFPFSITSRTN